MIKKGDFKMTEFFIATSGEMIGDAAIRAIFPTMLFGIVVWLIHSRKKNKK